MKRAEESSAACHDDRTLEMMPEMVEGGRSLNNVGNPMPYTYLLRNVLYIPTRKMVMTWGWFIIGLSTLICCFFGCFDGDAFMIWVLATWQNWLPMGAVLTTAWMVKLVACAPCNRWSLLALKSAGRPASSRLHQAFDSMMMGAGCLQGCSPFLGP